MCAKAEADEIIIYEKADYVTVNLKSTSGTTDGIFPLCHLHESEIFHFHNSHLKLPQCDDNNESGRSLNCTETAPKRTRVWHGEELSKLSRKYFKVSKKKWLFFRQCLRQ